MSFLRRLLRGRSDDDEGGWAGERERNVDAELEWLAERVADACIEDTLKLTEALSKRRPGEPLYHYLRARLLALTGREEEAIKELDEAIRLDPSNPELHRMKARLLYGPEAVAEIDVAIKLDPSNPEYRYERAKMMYSLGRLDEALSDLGEAVKLGPDGPKYRYARAKLLAHLNRYEEAASELGEAIRLMPDEPRYRYERAFVLYHLGRYGEALKEIDEAVRLDPERPLYRAARALLLGRLGRRDEAREAMKDLEGALRASLLKDLSLYLGLKGDEGEGGRRDHEAAARRYMAEALAGRRSAEEALWELEMAILDSRGDPEYRYWKAFLLYSMGRHWEALGELGEALRREPDRLEYRALRAIALDGVGNYEGALRELEKALDLHYYENYDRDDPFVPV